MIAGPACGVVLAGGRSTRMGRDKASLPWGGATMLDAVVRTLREALPHVIVVAAAGQDLPAVGADVAVVRDAEPGQGPLRGLATGLAAAQAAGHDWAFVSATDTPLLSSEVVRALLAQHHDALASGLVFDVVLATADGRDQPLAAVYRTALASDMALELAAGMRRVQEFLAGRPVRRLAVPPRPLLNVNTPGDLSRAAASDTVQGN